MNFNYPFNHLKLPIDEKERLNNMLIFHEIVHYSKLLLSYEPMIQTTKIPYEKEICQLIDFSLI